VSLPGSDGGGVIEILDGPCKGTFTVRRAPMYLRATVSKFADHKVDVLDQLDDEPARYEDVYVYVRDRGTWTQVFVRPGGRYETGIYRLVDPQPDDREVRSNPAWREWANAQAAVLA
jgi:hypothetical protein